MGVLGHRRREPEVWHFNGAVCMTSEFVYLDYQASTPTDPRVVEKMIPFLAKHWGNPSSPHVAGREAAAGVALARDQICELVGARYESEIIFTSGATEADHLAL